MKSLIIKEFHGIRPSYGDFLGIGFAEEAVGCRILNGTIVPARKHLVTATDALKNGDNSMAYAFGRWWTGTNSYFMNYLSNDISMLIYRADNGCLRKRLFASDSGDVTLGQPIPDRPKTEVYGTGKIQSGTYQYIITTVRQVGNSVDESGPSFPVSQTVGNDVGIKITAPTNLLEKSPSTYKWIIYRIGDYTSTYQLVAEVLIAEPFYVDIKADSELGDEPSSYYTSSYGNEIMFVQPISMTGLIDYPSGGMIFAWKGSKVYCSEPLLADAWHSEIALPVTVMGMFLYHGSVIAITTKGIYRISGYDPETLDLSSVLGEQECVSNIMCSDRAGLYYLSNEGIIRFNMGGSMCITNNTFGSDWFKDNLADIKSMFSFKGCLFLSTGNGLIRMDHTKETVEIVMDNLFDVTAMAVDASNVFYVLNGNDIVRYEGLNEYDAYTWKSGKIDCGISGKKNFYGIEVIGSMRTSAAITVWIDDTEVAQKVTDDFNLIRNRTCLIPMHYREGTKIQFSIGGDSDIEKVMIHYYE